jgi:hypothetical protein
MCLRLVVHLIKETNHDIGQKSLTYKVTAR